MKRIILIGFCVVLVLTAEAQSTTSTNVQTLGQANFLGYTNNYPLLFKTNATNRMKLNGNVNYALNGYNASRDGNLLIGISNNFITSGQNIYTGSLGAFSLLHINGPGSGIQEFGYRPWMQTGITLTGNRDLSYFGLRQVGSGEDITETTITWSDNAGTSHPGPDDMVFRFTGSGNGSNDILNDLTSINDLDGLHIARFAPTGEFGLGNTFGINIGASNLYVRPQSLMHLSLNGNREVWSQYTNENIGQTANDGLRIGFTKTAGINNGYIRWQENSSLILQTDWNNGSGGINNGERMRVTSVGSLVNNFGSGYGGLTTPVNRTRIAISADGSDPITKPLSLLHLGYNTGGISPFSSGVDGWRPWMDLGMFVSNKTDNVYIGLKPENGTNPVGVNDRMDAVVSWGDNGRNSAVIPPVNAPDVMRFIFTATQNSTTDSPQSKSINGLEVMRLYPERDTITQLGGLTYGRVGVGDFTAQGVNEQPTHKLDVVGNGRFRYLPDSIYMADTSIVKKYVMVDSAGVLRWTETPPSGGGIGNYCGATSNPLEGDYEIPLNDYNYHFTGQGGNGVNHVSIGYPCGTSPFPGFNPPLAKLDVLELGYFQTFGSQTSIAGRFISSPIENSTASFGLMGMAQGGSVANFGVYGSATGSSGINYAGYFNGDVYIAGGYGPSDSLLKTNIQAIVSADFLIKQLNPVTFDFKTTEYPQLHLNNETQMGLIAQNVETVLPNIVKENFFSAVYDSIGNELYPSINFKTIDYTKLIPLLIAGHKEQNTVIDSLKTVNDSLQEQITDLNDRLTQLENCLSGILPILCQMNQQAIQSNSPEVQQSLRSQLTVYLQNKDAIILDQNAPNPFAEQTIINFSIPESVKSAQILFYDGMGSLIKTVDIRERGLGSITVFGTDLSSGTYMYTLVADGVNVATKKMVKN